MVAADSRVEVMASISVTRLSFLERRMSGTDIVSTAGLMSDTIEKDVGRAKGGGGREIAETGNEKEEKVASAPTRARYARSACRGASAVSISLILCKFG